MTYKQRIGLTLVELVVVILILGVFTALVTIGVSSAREASRRNGCVNNLRQLGIALHAFESRRHTLPSNRAQPLNFQHQGRVKTVVSVHYDLLADLELTALKDLPLPDIILSGVFDNRGQPINHPHPLLTTPVAVFQCPSDSIRQIGTNYRFCTGPDAHWLPFRQINEGAKGPFGAQIGNKFQRVQRGLSNTIAASERLRSSTGSLSFRSSVWCASLSIYPAPTQHLLDVAELSHTYPPSNFFAYNGHYWVSSGYDCTLYNHVLCPNAPTYSLLAGPYQDDGNGAIMTATSNHRGGVNTLKCDAAIQFVNENIDQSLWQQLSVCER